MSGDEIVNTGLTSMNKNISSLSNKNECFYLTEKCENPNVRIMLKMWPL